MKRKKYISELSKIFGIPRTAISSEIKTFNVTGSEANRSGRGRIKIIYHVRFD